LKHPWLVGAEIVPSKIYNAEERANLIENFVYKDPELEDKTSHAHNHKKLATGPDCETLNHIDYKTGLHFKIKDACEAFDDKRLDHNDFEGNSLTSTQDPEKRNLSYESDVLGPFNSSEENNEVDLVEQIRETGMLVPKGTLKLSLKVKEINNRYERNNNGLLNDGVYIESEEDEERD